MWKVAVVQPVTEGYGFNITTEANVPLVSFATGPGPKPRRPQPMLRQSRKSRFGASSLHPAASAPMVGRLVGFLEQMKSAPPDPATPAHGSALVRARQCRRLR